MMNIVMVTSEAVPYAKTGGLGDVAGTLATQLSEHGHEVSLVLPFYRTIKENLSHWNLKELPGSLSVPMGDRTLSARVWVEERSPLLKAYFIEFNQFYDRPALYGENGKAYEDNGRRFSFLCKATLELLIKLKIAPDILHVNDWQASLVPYYLKTWFWSHALFKRTASVLTIHNMGYQGQSPMADSAFIGLNWMQVRSDEFEDHGGVNLLKGGIFYADMITTVSPTYAKEVVSEPGGCGLSSYLHRRGSDIIGILNGIDEEEWNCETDPYLPARYSADDLSGKSICKQSLQERFQLVRNPDIPIFGMVGRMAYQKGLQLVMECAESILSWELQLVVLGSGESIYTEFFKDLAGKHPQKVGLEIGFNQSLAHLIEAGSDFFIMPSLYEPCGLNQIYSMLYGTLPIVRRTGGLADTVLNFDEKTKKGTGFVFNDISAEALKNTIGWALSTWYDNYRAYQSLQQQAMRQQFGWHLAVEKYSEVYKKALERRLHWS